MEIMNKLSTDSLNKLRHDFEAEPDGLTLHNFVRVMMKHLPPPKPPGHQLSSASSPASVSNASSSAASPAATAAATAATAASNKVLVEDLVELFRQVDVNGDGTMEWNEFTGFCIDAGLAMASAGGRLEYKFQRASNFSDDFTEGPQIYRLRWLPKLQFLLVCEMNIPKVRVYSAARLAATDQDGTEEALPESKKPPPLTLAHDIDVREALQGRPDDGTMWPRDAAFLRKFDLLAVATSDFALTFWDTTCYKMGDESVSPRFVSRAHTREAQSLMEWCPPKNLLFTSGRSACVYGWTVTPLPVPKAAITCKLSGHRDFVQNLVFLPDLMVLTSASMDGTIKMWDVERLRLKSTRGGMFGHKKGVRALCVADHGILLSGGFDGVVLAWDTTGLTERPLFRLAGHRHPIASIVSVGDEAISLDLRGNLKWWSLAGDMDEADRCLQALALGNTAHALIATGPSFALIAAGARLSVLQKVRLTPKEKAPTTVLYNDTSVTIVAACGGVVKVWDAVTGQLRSTYNDLVSEGGELSQLCLDDRQRKFLVATHSGRVGVFNFLNGAPMKLADPTTHTQTVSGLVYVDADKCVVTTSWDRSLIVMDEDDGDDLGPMRQVRRAHPTDITALGFSHALSLIATGDADGNVKLWDFQFVFPEGNCVGHTEEVTAAVFVDPYPLLVTTDVGGNVYLWAVRPALDKNRRLAAFKNTKRNPFNGTTQMVPVLMSKVVYDAAGGSVVAPGITRGQHLLLTGDEQGIITVWDLTPTIDRLGLRSVDESSLPRAQGNYNARRKIQRDGDAADNDEAASLGTAGAGVAGTSAAILLASLDAGSYTAPALKSNEESSKPSISMKKSRAELAFEKELRHAFDMIDVDKSGTIEKNEMLAAVQNDAKLKVILKRSAGLRFLLKPKVWIGSFIAMDTDDSGDIDFDEFITFVKKMSKTLGVVKPSESSEGKRMDRAAFSPLRGVRGAAPLETKTQPATKEAPPGKSSRPSFALSSKLVVAKWQAHDETLLSLQIVDTPGRPRMIMTSSTDKQIRLWSMKGELFGILLASAGMGDPSGNARWNFPFDADLRQSDTEQYATDVLVKCQRDGEREAERSRLDAKTAAAKALHRSQMHDSGSDWMSESASSPGRHLSPPTSPMSMPRSPLGSHMSDTAPHPTAQRAKVRHRLFGQLRGDRTWDKTGLELAQEAMQKKELRRLTVQIDTIAKKARRSSQAQIEQAKNEELLATPRAEEGVSSAARPAYSSSSLPPDDLNNWSIRSDNKQKFLYPSLFTEMYRAKVKAQNNKQQSPEQHAKFMAKSPFLLQNMDRLGLGLGADESNDSMNSGVMSTSPGFRRREVTETVAGGRVYSSPIRKKRDSVAALLSACLESVQDIDRETDFAARLQQSASTPVLSRGSRGGGASPISLSASMGGGASRRRGGGSEDQDMAATAPAQQGQTEVGSEEKLVSLMRRSTKTFGGKRRAPGRATRKPAKTVEELRRPSRMDKLLARYKERNPAAEEKAEKAALATINEQSRRPRKKSPRKASPRSPKGPAVMRTKSTREVAMDSESPAECLSRVQKLKHFGFYTRAQVANVKRMFRKIDQDGSGEIELDEFMRISMASGSSGGDSGGGGGGGHLSNHLEAMFAALDRDNSGSVGIRELAGVLFSNATPLDFRDIMAFISATSATAKGEEGNVHKVANTEADLEKREEIRALFKMYDTDGSGDICINELRAAMNVDENKDSYRKRVSVSGTSMVDDLQDLLAAADGDGNMALDEEEFIEWMLQSM